MTDEKILELFFQRNEVAIAETNRKYGAYCYQIANAILNNPEDAEECLNDTWMKTWYSIPPAQPIHFRLFLAKIVRNISFNKYKAKYAKKRGEGELALVLEELEECIASQSDVESVFLAEELQETINTFVCNLPEKEGNIFIRRYFYLDSVKDISKRYHLTENHVSVLLNRTRNKLKTVLQKEGYF